MGHAGKTGRPNATGKADGKDCAQKDLEEPRTLLGTGMVAILVTFCTPPQKKNSGYFFCPCSKILSEAEFKYSKLFGVGSYLFVY